MVLFKFREDRLPVFLFVAYFALDVAVFFVVEQVWVVAAWMVLGIFPKACICAFGHHHQHLPTFRKVWLNRLLEVVYGFQTGIVSHAWFLHHVVGHHRHFLDQNKDESAWQCADGRKMGVVEYALVISLTGYPRAWRAGAAFPKQRGIFLRMTLVQLLLLALAFWYNWVNALFVFLLPMAISLFITAWHTWYHHAGLETVDEFHACNNIYHKWYNILTGNLGYHTAHHLRGSVHWSRLPEFNERFVDRIPAERIHAPCIPFRWMPAGDDQREEISVVEVAGS